MDDFTALNLSSAGMKAQRLRMRVVSENLANQHTTGPDGPYERKRVVMGTTPLAQSFEQTLDSALQKNLTNTDGDTAVQSVQVTQISGDGSEPVLVYDPSHPHANAQGYVAYPNISIFREMTDMIEASRSYEANLSAAKATQEMLNSATELIKR